ncbi:BTAD domain-containing putative transcriptional regulator [Polymorphospora rubra]|uniref:BTAD domain-containing putative transcriptional regulator n=1 Tax=Polymorphospora rubra TaxID=338584 RepID=UPI0033FD5FDF
MADFGGEIRVRRLRAGLTQEQLAKLAGISVRAVRDIEQGRVRSPRAESLRRIAEAVGLPRIEPPGPEPPRPAPPARPAALRIDVLGPLSIQIGSEPVALGSGRQRMLLGLLALHPDATVPRQEIVDLLWGHNPPDTCLNLVHTYVARLRRVLSQAGDGTATITHGGGGYRLRVDPRQLDLSLFTTLIGRAEGSVGSGLPSLDRLAGALSLWRGPVLADLPPRLAQHPAAAALNRRRIATAVTYATLAVELGLTDLAVRELHAVASHEPLHEQVHARLMLALAASGQQAQALALHRGIRDRLARQLGVEPGPELREAQLRILRQDLPGAAGRPGPVPSAGGVTPPRRSEPPPRHPGHRPPAQLPADVAYFTGRTSQMDTLRAMLAESRSASGPVISAITGMAGVGKTALAVHWAHRVRRQFPDGQLYVNLRGYSTASPVRESEALAGFLHALGVPAEQVPVDPGQAAALFRTMLDGRRMLLVLDNVATADQVRALLPGTPGCLVLVTSRDRLSGLVAVDGARRIDLDVLTEDEASTLLNRIIPTERVAAGSTEIAELAEVCARLPLALRIAAANLIDHPGEPISAHTARLTAENRLAGLRVDGDDQAAVRAAFDLSYAALPDSARRLFRLLGPAPGADISVSAAGALAGVDEPSAAHELDRLAAAHLVQQPTTGRYTFHDLLRIYAVERATVEDPAAELRTAIRRHYDWCRRRADAAAAMLYPHMVRLPADGSGPAPGPAPFASPAETLAWLEAEHTNLVRVVAHAADNGPDPAAWRIPDALRGYYQFRPHNAGFVAATNGLRAARIAADHAGEAASRLGLASLHLRRGEYGVGLAHATAMTDAAVRARWPEGEAAAYGTCGLMHLRAGRLTEAAELTRRAVRIHERLGDATRFSTSLGNLGVIYRDMGRLREAEEVFRQGVALTGGTGLRMSTGISLSNLGEVQHALGEYDEALRHLREALELSRETGYRPTEVESTRRLAALHVHTGDLGRATELANEALALAELVGDPAQQAAARNVLGAIHRRRDDPAAATEHLRALDLARANGARAEEAESLIGLAEVHRHHDPAKSLALAGQARTVARTAGYRVWEGHALVAAAEALRGTGPVTAARNAEEALAIHRETDHLLGRIRALRLLADLGAAGGIDPTRQAAYRGEADELSRRGRPDAGDAAPTAR